jgi:metal-dependent amidase/aminoacylase/carboxypeptidase family protein
MIRARTLEAVASASQLFDRCMRAGALALGASVEIVTRSGYLPNHPDPNLVELSRANCAAVVGADRVGTGKHTTGSTDVGDVSQIMPAVHPRSGGTEGSPHASDYWVRDHHLAAVNPAKSMAMTVVDLLCDGAGEARRVIAEGAPKLTRDQYLAARRQFDSEERFNG